MFTLAYFITVTPEKKDQAQSTKRPGTTPHTLSHTRTALTRTAQGGLCAKIQNQSSLLVCSKSLHGTRVKPAWLLKNFFATGVAPRRLSGTDTPPSLTRSTCFGLHFDKDLFTE